MTGYALTVLALSAAAGAVAGAFAIPRIADMLLSRAYLRSYTWWYRCLDDFAHYRDVCPDRLPRQNEKGTAGAVGIWLTDCRSQALKGALTHERAEALREAGIDVGKGASTRSEVEQQRPSRCSASRGTKAPCFAYAAWPWRLGWCVICGQG